MPKYERTEARYRFGNVIHHAYWNMQIKIPTPVGHLIERVDVVGFDILMLIGLDMLDRHKLQPRTVYGKLQCVPHR